MLHEQPGNEDVDSGDTEFTEHDEDVSKVVGESEFSTMFEVQEKSIVS
jgi:hypothetical protein